MGNRLRKNIDFVITPGLAAIPRIPGVPYRGSRSGKRTYEVCEWVSPGINMASRKVCRTITEIVTIPAQERLPSIPGRPGRPGTIEFEHHIGWTGRARSVAILTAGGVAEFTFGPSNVGAVAGFSHTPQPTGYADITHGFYANRNRLKILERGVDIGYDHYFSSPVTVRIERAGDVISYFVNDSLAITSEASGGPTFLAAAMYAGGDTVDDASLTTTETCVGVSSTRALIALGASGLASWNYGESITEPPTVQAQEIGRTTGASASAAPVCIGGSGVAYNQCTTQTGAPTVRALAYDLAPEYAICINSSAPPICEGLSTVWEVAWGGNATEPLATMGGDYAWDNGVSTTLAPTCMGFDRNPGEPLVILSAQSSLSEIIGRSVVAVILDTRASLQGLFVVTPVNRAMLLSELQAEIDLLPKTYIRAVLESLLSLESLSHIPNDVQAWVLHTDAGGMTRYENFDFTSFARIGDRYYGTKPDGIYLLEGKDDDGADIEQLVNFGSLNFGTSQRKALPYVYVGMASTGDTFVRVTSDNQTYTYRVRNSTEHMKEHRYELGRGLRGTFYEVELVSSGSMFDLESIEFFPVPLQRRL